MRAVIFDLDDTLYPEIEFVRSGFMAAAQHLQGAFGIEAGLAFSRMWEVFEKSGRGTVFDTVLKEFGIYSEERVRSLLHVYRCHQPSIELPSEMMDTLLQLRGFGYKLGIITDGMGAVQRAKVAALGIANLVDEVLYTDVLGREFWKPSPVPFRVMLELLKTSAPEALYVGDNGIKDFHGATEIGMRTVRLACYAKDPVPGGSEDRKGHPDAEIARIEELIPLIRRMGCEPRDSCH
jgi:putative hydrolase of the HAD superfamily